VLHPKYFGEIIHLDILDCPKVQFRRNIVVLMAVDVSGLPLKRGLLLIISRSAHNMSK
jgi:hypothetical protein